MASHNELQLLLALLEGMGLILSPCILPILPIMLAASLDGGKKRPIGIILGFIGAFTSFALLSRQILAALHADPEIIRNVALALLIAFGIVMLSRKLSDRLLSATQGLANLGQKLTSRWDQSNGFLSGIAIGLLIGLIWTPCAGPIMAAAVVQIIQARNDAEASLTVLMFALGAGLPMLAIALLGRQIMSRVGFLKKHSYAVRHVLGLIILVAAGLIYAGADVQLLGRSENIAQPAIDAMQDDVLINPIAKPYPAPQVAGVEEWLNSPPLKIADLRGKVVLVDFWTYSCINCVRTLPVLTSWDEKYRDKGLVIIGIHSPEFEFEKKAQNVKDALARYGIHYPVALDNQLRSWASFSNNCWPAHYLIDKNGQVVYTHFGEGEYGSTEHNIRVLLGLNGNSGKNELPKEYTQTQTPETYLGYLRAKNFVNEDQSSEGEESAYKAPSNLSLNQWSLDGLWRDEEQRVTTGKGDTSLTLHFTARKVFLVMGAPKGKRIKATILLNGKPVGENGGADVKDGAITIDQERLYELIDQKDAKEGRLEIQSNTPGLSAYAFTFGS